MRADDAVDVAVVAEDHVRVAAVDTVTVVVARDVGAGAAEDQVAAVGPLRAIRQAEEVELPPMMSSWPRLPKITSLPPLPSM